MAVNSLASKKKELIAEGLSKILELLTEQEEANMPGDVIGGVVASIVETDGEKRIKAIGNFDTADFFIDGMDMVRNQYYKPIAQRLVEMYEELKNVPINRILFIDVGEGKPKRKNGKPVFSKYAKSPKYMPELLGFDYIIRFFKANMQEHDTSFEQMVIMLYEQLRLIQVKEYEIIGFDNIYATFGKDWRETMSQLPNLMEKKIEWQQTKGSQLSLFDTDGGVLPFRTLK